MIYYVAGGAVRDLILGRALRDVDYVFEGADELFIQMNPSARKIKGMIPPLYLLGGQEFSPLPEGSDARMQNIYDRDFTINALLLDQNGLIRAHPLCFSDLRQELIRPVAPSSLCSSPVRALRAARFTATLPGFDLHSESLQQMRSLPLDALKSIAAEQAGRETMKACLGDTPGNYLRSLERGGCLAPWFEEFAEAGRISAGPPPWHEESVLEHTALVMDAVALACNSDKLAQRDRQMAVWMALCHDLGKCATPPELLPKHHGHEQRGEGMALELGKRLRLPAPFVRAGALAARLHMKAGRYKELRPGSKVDLLMQAHAAGMALPFFYLAAADSGQLWLPAALRSDLERLLAVSLPEEKRNLGAASGAWLRELRCRCL
ncbi:HD domain-containing protein [Desulfovibrio sp. OttesenSCG-928-F20]|nr:HD domain-containing protein [Desulfovibrio sp. OttesenSCG-928-M16]MDL2291419.1 HD domain-containing protein [Desulfovibrio sp. OttesenSCG-928-F20]